MKKNKYVRGEYYYIVRGAKHGHFDASNHHEGVLCYLSMKYHYNPICYIVDSNWSTCSATCPDGESITITETELYNRYIRDRNVIYDPPDYNSICTSGLFDSDKDRLHFRLVDSKSKSTLLSSDFYEGGNPLLAEFLSVICALAYLKKNNLNRTIYTERLTKDLYEYKERGSIVRLQLNVHPNTPLQERFSAGLSWLYDNEAIPTSVWMKDEWGAMPGAINERDFSKVDKSSMLLNREWQDKVANNKYLQQFF